jgi:hypothetical protein
VPDSFHGWALENTAIFLSPLTYGDDRIGLWMQQDKDTRCLAMFADHYDAQTFSDWMDAALAATGSANTALLEQLHARAQAQDDGERAR